MDVKQRRDHYEFVGLDASASKEAIAAAVQRLADQAAVLVYASPQRSHELWERIRQIREDLLLSAERRAAYDRSLREISDSVPEMAIVPTSVVPAPPAAKAERKAPSATRRTFLAPRLAAGALVALAIVLVAVFTYRSQTSRNPAPLALALSVSGPRHGHAYVLGQTVHLHWSALPSALLYRLQVATMPVDPSDAVVFRHLLLTRLSLDTTYSLKVTRPQLYYWRVQAYASGEWTPYTRSQHFAVIRPPVAPVIALSPPFRTTRGATMPKPCVSLTGGMLGACVGLAEATASRVHHVTVAAVIRTGQVQAAFGGSRYALVHAPHPPKTALPSVAALIPPAPVAGFRPPSRSPPGGHPPQPPRHASAPRRPSHPPTPRPPHHQMPPAPPGGVPGPGAGSTPGTPVPAAPGPIATPTPSAPATSPPAPVYPAARPHPAPALPVTSPLPVPTASAPASAPRPTPVTPVPTPSAPQPTAAPPPSATPTSSPEPPESSHHKHHKHKKHPKDPPDS